MRKIWPEIEVLGGRVARLSCMKMRLVSMNALAMNNEQWIIVKPPRKPRLYW